MEQFTKKAASALKLAAKAARRRGHSYIGSEHLLLGLLEEGEGTAAQVLIGAGVEEEKLKSLIDQLIAPEGGVGLASREGYTTRASAILENSVREAELFHMEQAGTEHILLTIIKDPECVATRLLHTMGVNLQKLYRAILDSMGSPLILYRRYEKFIMDAFSAQNLIPDIFCLCDDARGAMLWVREGLAVAIFPESMRCFCEGLHIETLAEPALETKILLIWKKGKQPTSLVQKFLDICMK